MMLKNNLIYNYYICQFLSFYNKTNIKTQKMTLVQNLWHIEKAVKYSIERV